MENNDNYVALEEDLNDRVLNKNVDDIINTLSSARQNNPDVVDLDNAMKMPEMPRFVEEAQAIAMDEALIMDDIKRNIVKNDNIEGLTIEEANYYKALKNSIDTPELHKEEENMIMESIMNSINENEALPGDIIEEGAQVQDSFLEPTEEVVKTTTDMVTVVDPEEIESEELMTMEDLENVPASAVEVEEEAFIKKANERYSDISELESVQLYETMTRYKSGEKFNVFEALPKSMKAEILKQASMNGVMDKSTINYFAKVLVNDLIDDTYLTSEIKNFEEEMADINSQLGNVTGVILDETNDELKEKFEDKLLELSEKIKDENPEKSESFVRIANMFHATYTLQFVREQIELTEDEDGNYSCSIPKINRAYKAARKWNQYADKFDEMFKDRTPRVRSIKSILLPLMKLGYHDTESVKTFAVMLGDSIKSYNNESIESHIYAYYIMIEFISINMSADTSEVGKILKENTSIIMDQIKKFKEIREQDPQYRKKNKGKTRK